MKRNETLVIYPGFSESRGFRMRIYESEVSFRRRVRATCSCLVPTRSIVLPIR